jgi:hypothetical protein
MLQHSSSAAVCKPELLDFRIFYHPVNLNFRIEPFNAYRILHYSQFIIILSLEPEQVKTSP